MKGFFMLFLVPVLTLLSCHPTDDSKPESGRDSGVAEPVVHPTLFFTPSDKDVILGRMDREPYASMMATIEGHAALDWIEPDPDVWDEEVLDDDANIAYANAFLAWLRDDEAAATKAKSFLAQLPTDFETNETWDVNIRMPAPLMGFTNAWDLLLATPWYTEEEAAADAERITTINRKFYERYVLTDIYRLTALAPSQNNHVIRTASAIGFVGLAFPDDPDAGIWTDFAASELDYLFSADGQYIQPDGGVSEGPFYFGFGHAAALGFALAFRNSQDPERVFHRTCINRQDVDPWAAFECVEGEEFTFTNLFERDLYRAAIDWSLSLRLPAGWRPPMEDAYFYAMNGMGVLSGLYGDGRYRWDWENNEDGLLEMGHGLDLVAVHLAHFDDGVAATEPTGTSTFMPDAGQAVFRSGWGMDDRWLLLTAEHGSVRKTLHDHVDGTSFSMAAYGEYLLVDPGYYKPNDLDNAVTSDATSHNVILVDGQGAPDKGLLTDFGDTDAYLENHATGSQIEYAEAWESYEGVDIERSILFPRGRYFVVVDRLSTTKQGERTFSWRLGGWAGYDVGHTFDVRPGDDSERPGARWERTTAGVDVTLLSTVEGLRIEEPAYTPHEAPHAEEFDRSRTEQDHGVIDGVVVGEAPGFLAILAPYRVGAAVGDEDGPLLVNVIQYGDGAVGVTVAGSGFVDWIILREPDAPETLAFPDGPVIETDAEITMFDEKGDIGLIARGTHASLDGVEKVAGDATDGVVAR